MIIVTIKKLNMKYLYQSVSIFLISCILFLSCKKNENMRHPLASLNVVSAVISGGNVKLNTNVRDSVKAYNAKVFGIIPGSGILLFPTTSPTTPFYSSQKETTQNGGVYSIFLTGTSAAPETIFVSENIPAPYSDSVIGVRIVNLSPNSTPLNVTLASATTTNLFSDIVYKQVTDFAKLPLLKVIPTGSVSFQIRSAANPGSVLATYTLPASASSTYPGISVNLQRFKNITIVIRGLMGTSGANGFGVFPVVTAY